jgi:transcriptional regulator with PAS, ATPase and Fis domain
VGKNHIASLVHRFSGRRGPFLEVPVPSIPEHLFESEVFGHLKGSFTGADRDRKGLVSAADGGTLFFDEISEVPVSFQAKLLQFIDTKRYRILGDTGERRANVRVIAATNRILEEEIQEKRFREDLYFRLSVLPINIPPLRDRKEDIRQIVLDNERFLKGKRLQPGFWKVMSEHRWPGNVRELINVVKRAGIEFEGSEIGDEIREVISKVNSRKEQIGTDRVNEILEEIRHGKTFWEAVKKPFLLRDLNRAEVREIVSRGLSQAGFKYKKLVKFFNLQEGDYHRFMRFLHEQRLIEK